MMTKDDKNILERFEAADKLIDELYCEIEPDTELGKLYTALVKSTNDIPELLHRLTEYRTAYADAMTEFFKLQKRCEALDRAIKSVYDLCDVCVYRATDEKEDDDICIDCFYHEEWKFDYERFAKQTGGDSGE